MRSNGVSLFPASAVGCRTSSVASRLALPCALAASVLMGSACSSVSLNSAPVEDRNQSKMAIPLPPGADNAGKPGYYTVKPGDTMGRVGQATGQNWRDIVRWNNLQNPNALEVGQVLRVTPPGGTSTTTSTKPISSGAAVSRPSVPVATPPPPSADDNVQWGWPAQGALLAGFNEVSNKGLDIAGKAGDGIVASADGRVVYAGAGLRGYGNLIILKHNDTYLTAYAHNRALLVKEEDTVKKGQKIAEMGNTDTDRVKLHFEIRRGNKPVDPAKYLPGR
jgi:lipoprotein NlpD